MVITLFIVNNLVSCHNLTTGLLQLCYFCMGFCLNLLNIQEKTISLITGAHGDLIASKGLIEDTFIYVRN